MSFLYMLGALLAYLLAFLPTIVGIAVIRSTGNRQLGLAIALLGFASIGVFICAL